MIEGDAGTHSPSNLRRWTEVRETGVGIRSDGVGPPGEPTASGSPPHLDGNPWRGGAAKPHSLAVLRQIVAEVHPGLPHRTDAPVVVGQVPLQERDGTGHRRRPV